MSQFSQSRDERQEQTRTQDHFRCEAGSKYPAALQISRVLSQPCRLPCREPCATIPRSIFLKNVQVQQSDFHTATFSKGLQTRTTDESHVQHISLELSYSGHSHSLFSLSSKPKRTRLFEPARDLDIVRYVHY